MQLELTMVADDWRWLVDLERFTLVDVSPFGDLFLKDPTGAFCLLDINAGELQYAEVAGSDPALLFPIAFDLRIATVYIKAGLLPSDGQCYGYKQQLVAGGSMNPSNVYVASLSEYVSFMGDFHRQIQDVPDGGTIRIKIINQKVVQ